MELPGGTNWPFSSNPPSGALRGNCVVDGENLNVSRTQAVKNGSCRASSKVTHGEDIRLSLTAVSNSLTTRSRHPGAWRMLKTKRMIAVAVVEEPAILIFS